MNNHALKSDLSETEQHKQHLVEAILEYLDTAEKKDSTIWVNSNFPHKSGVHKARKITIDQTEVMAGVNKLVKQDSLHDLFVDQGKAKTRRLPEELQGLNNIANDVKSAIVSGKIDTAAELGLLKAKKVWEMKQLVVANNLKDQMTTDHSIDNANIQMQLISALVTEVTHPNFGKATKHEKEKSKETKAAGLKLKQAWEECVLDMDLVDNWAGNVWQKHGAVLAAA